MVGLKTGWPVGLEHQRPVKFAIIDDLEIHWHRPEGGNVHYGTELCKLTYEDNACGFACAQVTMTSCRTKLSKRGDSRTF